MAGQSCDVSNQCAFPSYCKVADPFTLEGTCSTAYTDAGAECNFRTPQECGPGNDCFFEQVNFTDLCLPFAHGGQPCDVDVGPPCSALNDCVVTDGGTGGTCVPWSNQGGMCSTGLDGTSCFSSYCQADAGICAPRQANNASCTSAGQCASNRCINPDGGTADRICVMACY
jgi:hypothetical protein